MKPEGKTDLGECDIRKTEEDSILKRGRENSIKYWAVIRN
jgi:hypothetical protein